MYTVSQHRDICSRVRENIGLFLVFRYVEFALHYFKLQVKYYTYLNLLNETSLNKEIILMNKGRLNRKFSLKFKNMVEPENFYDFIIIISIKYLTRLRQYSR